MGLEFLNKMPFFVLGFGFVFSNFFPSEPSLLSPRFLSLYCCVIFAAGFYIYSVILHGSKLELLCAIIIGMLSFIFPPIIKIYFGS